MTRRSTLALALSVALIAAPSWSQAPVNPPPQPTPTPTPVPTPAPAPAGVTPRVVVPASVAGVEGNPVYIDASGSASERPLSWRFADGSPTTTLVKLNTDTLRSAVGMFPAPPAGVYSLRVVARGTPAGATEIDADAAGVVVTVAAKVAPTPTPKPTDPTIPPVTPPASPDTFGLTAFTRATLAALPWTAEARRPGATTLAAIFAAQAASSASYTSAQAYFTATDKDCLAALGPAAYASWNQALLKPLGGQFKALNAAGKLLTVAELSEAFAEISAALREASQ